MNKFLMGTTALVAATAFTAPALSAERIQLNVRGYHVGGIAITDSDSDVHEINFGSDSEVHFRGSTTLDNGLKVSFKAELELEDDSDVDGDADQIDEVYIQFDGGFGRIQFGQNDGVMDQMAITAPLIFAEHGHMDADLDPFEGHSFVNGTNDIDTVGDFSGDDIKISYFTPSFNGLQFGVSYTPNPCKNDTGYSDCVGTENARNYFEVSGSWDVEFDNVSMGISAGYGTGDQGTLAQQPMEWTIGGELGFGGFTFGGSYKHNETNNSNSTERTYWDLGASYETGPWALNVAYGNADGDLDDAGAEDDEATSWIAGVTYMYGPGMQIGFGLNTYESSDSDSSTDGTAFFIENAITF